MKVYVVIARFDYCASQVAAVAGSRAHADRLVERARAQQSAILRLYWQHEGALDADDAPRGERIHQRLERARNGFVFGPELVGSDGFDIEEHRVRGSWA